MSNHVNPADHHMPLTYYLLGLARFASGGVPGIQGLEQGRVHPGTRPGKNGPGAFF